MIDDLCRFMDMPIEQAKPEPGATLLMRYPYPAGEITFDYLQRIFDMLKDAFPDNSVVALPDSISLEECSVAQLTDIRNYINRLIEEDTNED